MKKNVLLFAIGLATIANSGLKAQSKTGFHVLKKLTMKSDGGWDYISIDGPNNKIYVSHGNQVIILSESTGDSIGVIPNTTGVHGIGIAGPFGKGYTSNGRSSDCTIFDLKTSKILGQVKVGNGPDAIFYDDFSKKVFTCNGQSNDATVIDPATDKVVATIPLGGKPETAVSDGKGNVFVNIENTSEIVRVDAITYKVTARYKLSQAEEPTGLAIDRQTGRLFTAGGKFMAVLDTKTGKQLAALPIGDGCDGVAFDPELKQAYTSNGEGTMTIIKEVNANKFVVVETIKTEPRARTIGIDPKTHHLFLPSADFQTLAAGAPGRPQMVHGSFRILEVGK